MASPDHIQQTALEAGQAMQFSTSRPSVKGPAFAKHRSKVARDLAYVLDVNPDVIAWGCSPSPLETWRGEHVSDFRMQDTQGVWWLLDAPDRKVASPEELTDAAEAQSHRYRQVSNSEIYGGFRLRNAKDLLRYAGYNVPLGDRVRFLSALDEQGPLSFADCLRAVRETQPVAALASLILQGFLEVELDDAIIGPETMVRRIRG